MRSLTDRTALVTGGSRGIGAAIARKLAAEGARVAITYQKSKDVAESLAAELDGEREHMALQADATSPDAVIAAVEKVASEFGHIDILVNNAGIWREGPFYTAPDSVFEKIINVNVRSVFAAMKAVVPHMREGGRIINIGSINGEQSFKPGSALYTMTKFAVAGLTRGAARDLAERGITVNCIQPGPIDTDMNPSDADHSEAMKTATALGRYGTAEEVAELAAFIAGSGSSYMTGAMLNIDGGFVA